MSSPPLPPCLLVENFFKTCCDAIPTWRTFRSPRNSDRRGAEFCFPLFLLPPLPFSVFFQDTHPFLRTRGLRIFRYSASTSLGVRRRLLPYHASPPPPTFSSTLVTATCTGCGFKSTRIGTFAHGGSPALTPPPFSVRLFFSVDHFGRFVSQT